MPIFGLNHAIAWQVSADVSFTPSWRRPLASHFAQSENKLHLSLSEIRCLVGHRPPRSERLVIPDAPVLTWCCGRKDDSSGLYFINNATLCNRPLSSPICCALATPPGFYFLSGPPQWTMEGLLTMPGGGVNENSRGRVRTPRGRQAGLVACFSNATLHKRMVRHVSAACQHKESETIQVEFSLVE